MIASVASFRRSLVRCSAQSASRKLGDRQEVAIGIPEPRNARTARGSPDAHPVLIEPRVPLRDDPVLEEPLDHLRDLGDLPAECGKWLGVEALDLLKTHF